MSVFSKKNISYFLLSFFLIPVLHAQTRHDKITIDFVNTTPTNMNVTYDICAKNSDKYTCVPQPVINLITGISTPIQISLPDTANPLSGDYAIKVIEADTTTTQGHTISSRFVNTSNSIQSNCYLKTEDRIREIVFNITNNNLFCTSFDVQL